RPPSPSAPPRRDPASLPPRLRTDPPAPRSKPRKAPPAELAIRRRLLPWHAGVIGGLVLLGGLTVLALALGRGSRPRPVAVQEEPSLPAAPEVLTVAPLIESAAPVARPPRAALE